MRQAHPASPERPGGDETWWVERLERRLRQLRVGRRVLLDLVRHSEQRRTRQVAALEAEIRRLRRRVKVLSHRLAAAQRELARMRAQGGGNPGAS